MGYDDYLEDKREDNQNCSVLHCVGPTTVLHNDMKTLNTFKFKSEVVIS